MYYAWIEDESDRRVIRWTQWSRLTEGQFDVYAFRSWDELMAFGRENIDCWLEHA